MEIKSFFLRNDCCWSYEKQIQPEIIVWLTENFEKKNIKKFYKIWFRDSIAYRNIWYYNI